MNTAEVAERDKVRKDNAKKAVALAMNGKWEQAAQLNRSILVEFPRDLESYNRLGKALSELGRNKEARKAFQSALEISPHNAIAKKNLERLVRLGDDAPVTPAGAPPQVFIGETGRAVVTSLVNLAPPSVRLKLAPGHPVELVGDGGVLKVSLVNGDYAGKVEPKLAARLTKLIRGGNRYQANVTSATETELTVIILEVFKHPSQMGVVSFPSRQGVGQRVYVQSAALDYDLAEQGVQQAGEALIVKDWSDDDTEPGDDTAFTPVFDRIINTNEEASQEDDEF
ncbi:MAG: tetratricopeptide repeat protein [Chloroflexi bacterium]|nr:tetratricopeptide repeat protein [Chloroflexota bacterium]